MPEQTEQQPNGVSKSKRAQRRAQKKQIQKQLKNKEEQFASKHQHQHEDGTEDKEKEKEMDGGAGEDEQQQEQQRQQKEEKKPQIKQEPEIEIEQLDTSNPLYAEMSAVFAAFAVNLQKDANVAVHVEEEEKSTSESKQSNQTAEEKEAAQAAKQAAKGLSKKKLKQLARLSIADLKQLVAKPEVVEVHDVNSADPKLLVSLKSYRNTVPVPIHWCQKRKYLQNKRGYEKPPWELPLFIADTGIAKIRGAQAEKEAAATAKAKGRQRMQPKMGKIDIDYQILHDAFFRYQTKPKMTAHGDMYYEGREFEQKLVDKRPGVYSQQLKAALGMTDDQSPPPWLHAMQRYGPPPSYPHLQIPGVNAPIPVGCRWGSGPGEWGNPPLNELGQPLWGGDLFGQVQQEEGPKIDRTLWGHLEEESEGEEEEEEEEEAAEEEEEPDDEGMRSVSSFASGLETPETIQLRKAADGTGTETPNTVNPPRQLYTVLEEKKTAVAGQSLFGSQHTYVLPTEQATADQALAAKNDARRAAARGEVAVALNPEDLENLDAATLKRKYEQTIEETKKQAKAAMGGAGDEELDVQKRKKPKTDKSKDKSKKDELKGFKF